MDQSTINLALSAILAAIGWFARQLWEAVKTLKDDIHHIEADLPKTYVLKSDLDKRMDHIKSFEDLGDHWQKETQHYFEHYKDLKKPGTTKVLGWGDAEAAKQIIAESIERYKNK